MKQMTTYDFRGEVWTPCPLCLHPYQSFKQFEFTFYLFFCQFTKRLQRQHDPFQDQRDRAHQFRPRVVLKLGSHVMMALTQENVHYTLNSGTGVMNKSNRVHAQIQDFFVRRGGGWGWGGGSRPDGQKTVWTMFFFNSLQSGSNGFITKGRRGSNFFQGVKMSKETHITFDFPGGGEGSGPPNPPSGSARGVA